MKASGHDEEIEPNKIVQGEEVQTKEPQDFKGRITQEEEV
jgi:hypothetical protein